MRNVVYYRIGIKGGKLQYHVSGQKEEAVRMASMSRSISLKASAEDIQSAYDGMLEDATFHMCVSV